MNIQTELAVFVRDLGRAQRDKNQKRKQPSKENRGKRSKKVFNQLKLLDPIG